MTILTKPNVFLQIKKEKCPAPDETIFVEEDKAETYTRKPNSCSSFGLVLMVLLAVVVGIYSGIYLYRRNHPQPHRYQGFCSIPIDTKQLQETQFTEYRMLPLRWTSSSDPDVQVFATDDADELVNFLREELDIGDTVEKITVYDNGGRQTSFIHDFGSNVTEIVDGDRCFTMDLDPALVLAPDAFVLSIQSGGQFDITRVRSSLRAVLPALGHPLPEHCHSKPAYRLIREEAGIRKRSASLPTVYMQFAGRHVHEIEISNMADILEHEKK